MVGREDHERGPEQGVGSRREHRDRTGGRVEVDARSGRPSDPVALHRLQGVGPVEPVEVVDQSVGIRRDAHHPLAHRALEHGEVATITATVGGDFLVGDDRAEPRAPVDRRFGDVGQALRVDDRGAFGRRQRRPGPPIRRRPGASLVLGDELGDRPRPAGVTIGRRGVGVVPRVEDAGEDPLRPLVVPGVGRLDGAPHVVAHPQPAQLLAVVDDVRRRRDGRVLAGLHGKLLGGQAEGVEAHGVQHVATGHPLIAGEHVGADESERMADVQAVVRRVREHVEDEQLLAGGFHGGGIGERAGGVGRLEDVLGIPLVLPAKFEVGRQGGVVAERRGVSGLRLTKALNWWFPSTYEATHASGRPPRPRG